VSCATGRNLVKRMNELNAESRKRLVPHATRAEGKSGNVFLKTETLKTEKLKQC
jgi:hypothetical protein